MTKPSSPLLFLTPTSGLNTLAGTLPLLSSLSWGSKPHSHPDRCVSCLPTSLCVLPLCWGTPLPYRSLRIDSYHPFSPRTGSNPSGQNIPFPGLSDWLRLWNGTQPNQSPQDFSATTRVFGLQVLSWKSMS